jgi:O-antigen/teichoic acid export membrane protein
MGIGLYAIAHGIDTLAYLSMIPLITRSVSPTVFGQLTLLLVGAQVVLMFLDLGIGIGLLRELSDEKDPDRKRTHIASVFWFRILLATVGAVFVFAGSFAAASPMREALQLAAPTVLFWSLFGGFIEIFRAQERHAELAFGNVIRSVTWSACILIFVVRGGFELVGLVAAYAVSYAAAVMLMCWRLGWQRINRRPDVGILRRMLRFGLPIGGYYILRAVGGTDRYLVEYRSTVADAGLVQLGSIPGGALEMVEKIITLPAEPYLFGVPAAERENALRRVIRLSAFVMSAAASVFSMFAPEMVSILAPSGYAEAVSVIAWYTFAAIHRAIMRILGLGAGLVGNTRLYLISAVVELLIVGPALYFVIPYTGVAGAGFARYVASSLSIIYSYHLLRKLWQVDLPIGAILFFTTVAPLVATLTATAHFGVIAPLAVRVVIVAVLMSAGYLIIMRPPGRRFTRRAHNPTA